jgi:thiol-disulfide isomerase/thioredoxin
MSSTCSGQHVGWQSGYGEAETRADKDALPILLHFGAWYCGPCQRMERDVFPDAQVQQALGSEIASVKIDVSHEPDLASQYGASTVPRDVVVFPDGTVETLNVGYVSKASYLSMLRSVVARSQQMGVPKPVEPGSRINPEVSNTATNAQPNEIAKQGDGVLVATVSEPSVEAPMIGLEGYCPVRLHEKRQWTPGATLCC